MMIKKNMQINEFALQELMKKSGNAPAIEEEVKVPEPAPVTQAATSAPTQGDAGVEDEQMRLILEMSRVAQEEADKAAREEEEMIRQAIEASQQEEQQRLQVLKREETMTEQAIAASSAAATQEEEKQPEMVSPQDMPQAIAPKA